MPTRNVVLTDHQAALIERLVATGRYQNASEVLRAGLRLVERLETAETDWLAWALRQIEAGEADIAAGRATALDSEADRRSFVRALGRREG